jgi:hypothetical protein
VLESPIGYALTGRESDIQKIETRIAELRGRPCHKSDVEIRRLIAQLQKLQAAQKAMAQFRALPKSHKTLLFMSSFVLRDGAVVWRGRPENQSSLGDTDWFESSGF